MSFIPATVLKLCKNVPLDISYKDTFAMSDPEAQMYYFSSKVKHTFTDFSYQRVNDSIIVPVVADACYDCNYVMFNNANYGTKWFYGFIKSVKYLSPHATEIQYTIDVFQTWFFDINIKPSFVDREHVNDDTLFSNLIPEPLESGENIIEETQMYGLIDGAAETPTYKDMAIVIAHTPYEGETELGKIVDGVYSGVKYKVFPMMLLTDAEIDGQVQQQQDNCKI